MASTRTRKGLTPRWAISTLAVVVTLLLTACRGPERAADPQVGSGVEDLRQVSGNEEIALPVELPPDFNSVSVSHANGLPVVDLYSANQPLVTVCTGSAARCRQAIRFATEIRTVDLGEFEAVVGTAPDEPPGEKHGLESGLARFWREVELSTAQPDWLERDR